MTTQKPSIQLEPVWNGGAFDHWRMGVGNGTPVDPPYPTLTVDHGNNADLTFTITNPQGIQFQPNNPPTSAPIYIQPGSQKPTGGVDGDFKNIQVKNDPKTGAKNAVLVLHDGNQKGGTFTYVLNFNGAKPLDPIVDNGGGGPGFYSFSAVEIAGIVAGLAVIAVVLWRVFRKPEPVERPIKDR
jgi:hypothetical protein